MSLQALNVGFVKLKLSTKKTRNFKIIFLKFEKISKYLFVGKMTIFKKLVMYNSGKHKYPIIM